MIFETIQTEAISAGADPVAAFAPFAVASAASVFWLIFPFRRKRKRRRRKARPLDYVAGALFFIGFSAFFIFLSTLRN